MVAKKGLEMSTREFFLQAENRDGHMVSQDTKCLWKIQLDMLEVFIGICRRHNLRWFLEFGSMLGAIRHQGMIPWDDDLDVSMPRVDYDRFLSIAKKELPPDIFLQAESTEADHIFTFSRLRKKNTTFILSFDVEHHFRTHMGIFVDIYPLDGYPCGWRLLLLKRIVRTLWTAWEGGKLLRNKLVHLFGKPLVRLRVFAAVRKFILRGTLMENCDRVAPRPGDGISENQFIRSRWYSAYREVPFEYLKVRIPIEAEKILTQYYGDWTIPVRGGASHSVLKVDCQRDYKDYLRTMPELGYTEKEISKMC